MSIAFQPPLIQTFFYKLNRTNKIMKAPSVFYGHIINQKHKVMSHLQSPSQQNPGFLGKDDEREVWGKRENGVNTV